MFSWEQCKLGDIATFSKGNGYSKSDLAPSGEPIILYGRLYTNYETTIRNVDTFVELKDKSVISQGGEVIVPASGETAEDISRASVVKNQGIIIGGDLNVIKVNHLLNPTFLALTISNGEQQKELSKRAQGKSVVHLHNSDLQEVNLTFPLLNEQKEISSLFEKMDSVITLHQCKLEKLKLTKKVLLQKLFPKNGKHIPEIRFKDFTDAWEQRKLEDLVDVLDGDRGKNYPKEFDFDVQGHTLFLNAANVTNEGFSFKNNQYITEEKSNSMGNGRLVEDDVIITSRGSLGHIAWYNQVIQCVMPHVRINSGMLILRKRVDISMSYLQQFLRSYKGQSQISFISFGSAQPQLTKKDVQKINIIYPANLKEQIKIETYFSTLDNLITLNKRKLERLQEEKKGLLQKIYV